MSKTILVTGGSRGIGAACALLAARQGYRVCINWRARCGSSRWMRPASTASWPPT
jgi:NAD(P)-dependent dehydrogenase (short-subunit alcohol dehydrogenase family)